MRTGVFTIHHVFGDQLTHAVHFNDLNITLGIRPVFVREPE